MSFICIACGNTEYWETEVQTSKVIIPTVGTLLIDNMLMDGDDWSEQFLREQIADMANALLRAHSSEFDYDAQSGQYRNRYVSCAVCGSYQVTPPWCEWKPPSPFASLDEEIIFNRAAYKQLIKKRGQYENNLPVLWQPQTLPGAHVAARHL